MPRSSPAAPVVARSVCFGFTWEVLEHLYLKRAWVHETSFGPADAHAAFLAGRLAPIES